jgi:hypothetical protein
MKSHGNEVTNKHLAEKILFKFVLKDPCMSIFQILLNSDQHLNPSIFFFLNKRGVFWKF